MNERITEILTPCATELGAEIVSVKWMPGLGDAKHKRNELEIRIKRIDHAPVGIALCSDFSRRAGAILDVEDPIKQKYDLVVSSPGTMTE